MNDTVGGLILIILGLYFAIFHKKVAHRTAEFYYKLFHIHFSEKLYQVVFLIVGIAFAVFGLLSILRIITFK